MKKGITLGFPKFKEEYLKRKEEIKEFLEKYNVSLIEYRDPVTGEKRSYLRRKSRGIWGKSDRHILGRTTRGKVIKNILEKT